MQRLRGLLRVLLIIFLLLALAHLFSPYLWRLYYPLRYQEHILTYSRKNHLDPFLVAAVIRVESSFDPEASSHQGARGLMQLMPETSAWIAEQIGIEYSPELLLDPEYNIRLGCWYLRSLSQEFDSLPVALAAYNAGRGRVRGWLDQGLWNGRMEAADDIPYPETRDFLRRVTIARQRYSKLYPQVWIDTKPKPAVLHQPGSF